MLSYMGIVIAITRVAFDPFIMKTLHEDLKMSKRRKKKSNFSTQALCSFANSAMNVEYVYLILISVDTFYGGEVPENSNQLTIKKDKDKTEVQFKYLQVDDNIDLDISKSETDINNSAHNSAKERASMIRTFSQVESRFEIDNPRPLKRTTS